VKEQLRFIDSPGKSPKKSKNNSSEKSSNKSKDKTEDFVEEYGNRCSLETEVSSLESSTGLFTINIPE